MDDQIVIGVLGGMGTYATIHLFSKYAEVFSAEKEWERPRIIIDNNCTMPSRVKAVLYNEDRKRLISEMTASIRNLMQCGANRIIIACNTAHIFLNEVYRELPEAEEVVVNLIDNCVFDLKHQNIKAVYLLATEGTIQSRIYGEALEKAGINCQNPNESELAKVRACIEAVKQKRYSDYVRDLFMDLTECGGKYILGCTELPILAEKYYSEISRSKFYDPLMEVMRKIKAEYNDFYKV